MIIKHKPFWQSLFFLNKQLGGLHGNTAKQQAKTQEDFGSSGEFAPSSFSQEGENQATKTLLKFFFPRRSPEGGPFFFFIFYFNVSPSKIFSFPSVMIICHGCSHSI